MCLGIPGEVVELVDSNRHLAKVDVAGVRRNINIGLLEDLNLVPGDWVLIHVGFAMAKIDEEEAQRGPRRAATDGPGVRRRGAGSDRIADRIATTSK